MKKALLLLSVLPLVVGALYMRSLVSWRPQKLFVGQTRISQLAFSSNGKVLLVGQNYVLIKGPKARLTALDAANGYAPRWSYESGNNFLKPQFFLNDSCVFVSEEYGGHIKALDTSTGQSRLQYGIRAEGVSISFDGKWLASHGDDGVNLERTDEMKASQTPRQINIKAAPREIISPAFAISPDSRTLVVQVTEFYRSRLDFYDIPSGKRTQSHPDFPSRVFGKSIQWSRNGRFLLSTWYFPTQPMGVQTSWSLWRTSDGQKLASTTLPYNQVVPRFEVEDDGRVLSYWMNTEVLRSQPESKAATAQSHIEIPGEKITAAALSPDGSQLIAGTASGRVYSQRLK